MLLVSHGGVQAMVADNCAVSPLHMVSSSETLTTDPPVWPTLILAICVQPEVSVTVIVYVSAVNPVLSADVGPSDQA